MTCTSAVLPNFISPLPFYAEILSIDCAGCIHTHNRRVPPAHISQRITSQKAGSLGLWGRATGQLLVEADNPLHACGVCGASDGLSIIALVSEVSWRLSDL